MEGMGISTPCDFAREGRSCKEIRDSIREIETPSL